MFQPSITVVIPLFNKAAHVEAAISSVLAQENLLEVIVVDDGSTDEGPSLVSTVADHRVKLIRQANSGVSSARNKGINAASGDYIAFLDADDEYLDGFLATISKMIRAFPEAGLYATGHKRVFADGKTIIPTPRGVRNTDEPQLLSDFFYSWSRSTLFSASSVCVRSAALKQKSITFPVGERLGEDQDFWFLLAQHFPVVFCRKVLSVYNMNVADSATSGQKIVALLPSYLRLSDRIEGPQFPERFVPSARRLIANHYLNVALNLIDAGDHAGAVNLIVDPRAKYNLTYWLRCYVRCRMGFLTSYLVRSPNK